MKNKLISCFLTLLLQVFFVFADDDIDDSTEDSKFEDFEIRIIRPKFFIKKHRLELGAQTSIVPNQTFVYSYIFSGGLTYHFSDFWAIEGVGGFGLSSEKADKTDLNDNFGIKTAIMRTSHVFNAQILWTPIYGKYQKTDGKLVYFDTFISAGGGLTGIDYKYDNCSGIKVSDFPGALVRDTSSERVVQYPSFFLGIGQRIFLSQQASLRWDIVYSGVEAQNLDGKCVVQESETDSSYLHNNVFIKLGLSRFL